MAMILRYVASFLSYMFLLLFFSSLPLGYSKLSSNQRAIMSQLFDLVRNTTKLPFPWNDVSEDPCLWKGVSCNNHSNSSIIGLALSGFFTSASDNILPLICRIESLQTLDFSNNHLNTIPDEFISRCGGLNGLSFLNFTRNRLSGSLPTFQGFFGMEILDLSYNNFTGDIDLQLAALLGLRQLNLSSNRFTGSVPTHLTAGLEMLVLSKNSFHGEIPKQFMTYSNLTRLDLSENKLFGSVPHNVDGLSKLEVLVLSSNLLQGEIPRNLVNIKTLIRFAANQNSFTGIIPSGITAYLKIIDLSYNNLSGCIPSDFLHKEKLESVDLTNNQFIGPIPSNLSLNLVRLRLGSNSLKGSIPLMPSEKLAYLELDNNKLGGTIPPRLGTCRNLTLLNLANNNFIGALPVQLGNLSHLRIMKLQSNKLEGTMPEHIFELKNLLILNLSLNSLHGSIPPSISKLQSLNNLCLQSNNLSGSIPDSISGLKSLLELQLGSNQLSGDIPSMPQGLQIALNLSNNNFKGPIPRNLNTLSELEVLDLSNNKFSGTIPDFLDTLPSLIQLILSNNSLSGVNPVFRKSLTVNTTGNVGLYTATKKKVKSTIVVGATIAASSAVLAVGAVFFMALTISRRYYPSVRSRNVHSGEEGLSNSNLQNFQTNLLTSNSIHRSNINIAKAMSAVSSPSNIKQKTRFSTYYEAIMPSGMTYFVKKLNLADKIFQKGSSSHDKFGEELQAISKMSNSNVMIPLAYVLTLDSAYILYEYTEKGSSLFDVLHGSPEQPLLDWVSRYSIALGVAQGLAFLHGLTNSGGPLLLLDLSSKTIMLKSMKEPQIGDIELYKVMHHSKNASSFSTVAGTAGYIPPEYAYTMRITTAGNVYSFGVILLELLTGKAAVSDGMELSKWALNKSGQDDNNLDRILDPKISKTSAAIRSQMLAVMEVALNCVSASVDARPRTKTVLRMLINSR